MDRKYCMEISLILQGKFEKSFLLNRLVSKNKTYFQINPVLYEMYLILDINFLTEYILVLAVMHCFFLL